MKRKKTAGTVLLGAVALVLAGGVTAGQALAYFTSYASAGGRVQLSLGFTETETNDTVRDWTKHISITNTGENDCYIRVKVFAGEKYRDFLEYSQEGESWVQDEDGYWYYGQVVMPGETTGELLVRLHREKLSMTVEDGEEEEFNVIVVQECTAVLHDGAGNPYADWDSVAADPYDGQDGVAQGVDE